MTADIVVFDVDGTVSDGCVNREGGTGQARPGIHDLFEVLHVLGFRIHLWSSCGKEHAAYVAKELKLPHIGGCHDKLVYPVLPQRIALIVDDLPEFLAGLVTPTLHFQHAYEILHPGCVFEERDLN